MKVFIVITGIIVAFLGVSVFGQQNLAKCPHIKPVEPISAESLLGTWFTMRVGPPCPDYEGDGFECVSETYWIDSETPKNIVNSVYHRKANGAHVAYKGSFNTSSASKSNHSWQYTLGNATFPVVFVATDKGHSWFIAYSCMETTPHNFTIAWAISSRNRAIDPKLEQTLVQDIQRYSGIKSEELVAVGHIGCY